MRFHHVSSFDDVYRHNIWQ